MLRLLIITFVIFIALHHNPAEAQIFGRWKNSSRGAKLQRYESQRPLTTADHRERSSRTSSGLDIRIGVGTFPGYGYYPGFGAVGYLDPYRFDGFGYDPYRYGRFEAPDLLNDPYFRERYRYDSKYPGRYRVPKVPSSSSVIGLAELYGFRSELDPRRNSSIPFDSDTANHRLLKVTETLAKRLEVSEYGEAWLEYLNPRQIPALISEGKTDELQELLSHYDGVVANPELKYISVTLGFAETRNLLRSVLGRSIDQMEERAIRVTPTLAVPIDSGSVSPAETLPTPQPTVEQQPDLNPANGR